MLQLLTKNKYSIDCYMIYRLRIARRKSIKEQCWTRVLSGSRLAGVASSHDNGDAGMC